MELKTFYIGWNNSGYTHGNNSRSNGESSTPYECFEHIL